MARNENAPNRSKPGQDTSSNWAWHTMQKKLVFLILAGLLLSGCQLRRANRLLGSGSNATLTVATSTETQIPTEPPTHTPPPPPTITPTPAPDAASVGLPAEPAGTTPLDFAADACKAVWSNGTDTVPCKGTDPSTTSGYIIELSGDLQGFPSNIPMLLMYPPRINGDTLLGTYPSFTVQKGDRFRVCINLPRAQFLRCGVRPRILHFQRTEWPRQLVLPVHGSVQGRRLFPGRHRRPNRPVRPACAPPCRGSPGLRLVDLPSHLSPGSLTFLCGS